MTQNYRDLQKSLKQDRQLERVSKSFRLNQKKDVLINKIKEIKDKKLDELKKVKMSLDKARDNQTVSNLKLNNFISIKDIIKSIKIPKTNKLSPVISYGNKNYTLNNMTRKRLLKNFGDDDNKLFTDNMSVVNGAGSDNDILSYFTGNMSTIKDVSVKYIDLTKKKKKEGAWFPYYNNTKLDLTCLQIFQKDNFKYEDNCFIYALKQWGQLEDHVIDEIKRLCKNDVIPQSSFKLISEKYDFGIVIKRIRNDERKNQDVVKFNANKEKVIELGLIEEHYFYNTKLPISLYCIKNYDQVKDYENFQLITKMKPAKEGFKPNRDNKVSTDAYKIVVALVENKETCLEVIEFSDFLMDTPAYKHVEKKVDIIKEGCYDWKNFKAIEPKEFKNPEERDVYFFDFETTTNGDNHKPYLCSWVKNDEEPKSKRGNDCGLEFLKTIDKDSIIIVHNLAYDFNFLIKYLRNPKCVRQSSSRMPFAKASFKNFETDEEYKLNFKCSYTLTDLPLRKFAQVFDLKDVKKDVMPYGAYNTDTVNKKDIGIKYAEAFFKDETDKQEFKKNIKQWELETRKGYFDHIKYSEIYCEHDVKTTKAGFDIYRKWIKEVTKLDIMNFSTVASFADEYLKSTGCYDETYQMSGTIREYIQGFVVGGRTMCSQNKKSYYKVDGVNFNGLSDFDACSLYPSAMKRLNDECGGFLKGKPIVLNNKQKNLNFLRKSYVSGYFVTVNIKNLPKHYDFPLLSNKNDDGIRMFENKTGVYKLCKIELEDVIKFHEVKDEDIEILGGVYFNKGRNPTIGEIITDLYKTRKEKKKAGNPIEVTYKLLMNSSYGKTCIKEHDIKQKFVTSDRLETYLVENYNHIISYEENVGGSKYAFIDEIDQIKTHFNSVHIGVEILAMSKRIMNEVMCLAYDLGIKIYYQDTDSMHIENDKIPKLSKAFKEKYNRDLIGSDMGQFHSDFDFNSEEDITAIESYFLGKKCYIDKVRLVKDGKEIYDYHIRMKGIPSDVVKSTAYEGDYMNLYKRLYEGEEITFDLLADPFKKRFQISKGFEVTTRGEDENDIFTRTLKF